MKNLLYLFGLLLFVSCSEKTREEMIIDNIKEWGQVNFTNPESYEPVKIDTIEKYKENEINIYHTYRINNKEGVKELRSNIFTADTLYNIKGESTLEDWVKFNTIHIYKNNKTGEVKEFMHHEKPVTDLDWDWVDSKL